MSEYRHQSYGMGWKVSKEAMEREEAELRAYDAYCALPWWKRLFKKRPPYPMIAVFVKRLGVTRREIEEKMIKDMFNA